MFANVPGAAAIRHEMTSCHSRFGIWHQLYARFIFSFLNRKTDTAKRAFGELRQLLFSLVLVELL